ncbi:hypothetical protein DUI87_14067 [Hirundo rustica rustica]|uniref:Borealin N-terminal domain-containing protein n=1 Tax=Hirundo rustica rustica TaxID=333673 RepID=A0A3M0K7J0_HIRRU|nr:hypothetical protein DUI87_14067 [Hirundo rustica rustica]
MAPGKAPCRRRSSDSGVEPDRGALPRDRDQRTALSQKKKDQRIALFLSDFDQQAKEHIQEMKKELDSLLQTAEKAFAVELLTMPAAVRKMKRKEVLVKVTTIVEYEDAKHSSAKKITKKTLCTAGGDLRNIDVQLLNQDTVQHIHNLVVSLNWEAYRAVYADTWSQAFTSHSVIDANLNSLEFNPKLVGISWREEEGGENCCTWIMCKSNCTYISTCSLVIAWGTTGA